MININHRRLILVTLISAFLFLVLSVPNSYSKKNVYRDARCDCVNELKGSCTAVISLKKIDNKSQGASLNYYSLRIQVPTTKNCARVIYYVGMDPNTRIVKDGIYTENFSYLQDLNQAQVRLDSCNVCGDLYRDNPSEKTEQEKRDIDKWLDSGEKRAREDNEHFKELSRNDESADDELEYLVGKAEDDYEKDQQWALQFEQRMTQLELDIQRDIQRAQELKRRADYEDDSNDDEGGGFMDFMGEVFKGVALGSAMVADIEMGTSHNTTNVLEAFNSINQGIPPDPSAFQFTSQGTLNSGNSTSCSYARQRKPILESLMRKAQNAPGVCDKSRATVKMLQENYNINKKCGAPNAQLQSIQNTLNGAKESAIASCGKGTF